MNRVLILFLILTSYTFSQKGNSFWVSSNAQIYFDKTKNFWEKGDSSILNYDATGKLIEEVHFIGSMNPQVSYVTKYFYSNNLLSKVFDIYQDRDTESWDTISFKKWSYTLNNSIQSITTYKKQNGVWIDVDRLSFEYDLKNRISLETTSEWDEKTNQLISNQKKIYYYSSNGDIEIVIRQICNQYGFWVNTGKDSSVFSNGLKKENYQFYYDDKNKGEWLKTSKETYVYNENKLLSQTLIQNWSYIDNSFVTDQYSRLITTIYDEKSRLYKVIDQVYDMNVKKFNEDNLTNFYYQNSQQTSIENQLNKTEIHLFPNPAFDSFVIQSTDPIYKVLISDATGKVIKEFDQFNLLLNKYAFDISDLSEEIYFTTVVTKDGTYCNKLLIKR